MYFSSYSGGIPKGSKRTRANEQGLKGALSPQPGTYGGLRGCVQNLEFEGRKFGLPGKKNNHQSNAFFASSWILMVPKTFPLTAIGYKVSRLKLMALYAKGRTILCFN
jgi:hypothetical protein